MTRKPKGLLGEAGAILIRRVMGPLGLFALLGVALAACGQSFASTPVPSPVVQPGPVAVPKPVDPSLTAQPAPSSPTPAPSRVVVAVPKPVEPSPTPQPAVPSPTSAPSPTPSATQSATSEPPYSSDIAMWGIFAGVDWPSEYVSLALEQIRIHKEVSQVPVIIEFMRFVSSERLHAEFAATLKELTGQEFGELIPDWPRWMEWLGNHSAEYRPPEQYVEWKANLLSVLDPRFVEFLIPGGRTSRIDLTQVVWGGVLPDGIPDLQDPETLSPEEADYLLPDDRVFGVSINGENKAYPLRVVNAHEMVNDTVGGEPIALAY